MQISKSENKIHVGVTIGDPSGIGPAMTLAAVGSLRGIADFTVIGDSWVLEQVERKERHKDTKTQSHKVTGINFIDLGNVAHKNFEFGKVKAEYGKASIEYLDKALELIDEKEIDCLVTAPISKEAINKARFRYSGHTEYFSEKLRVSDPVMMLMNNKLRFSLVTRHIPLKDVSLRLSAEKIYRTSLITLEALKTLFLIKKPRVVVCALNPHASDNGLIGDEEGRLIKPAVKRLKAKDSACFYGPLPSDAAVYKAYRGEYDCVIAMYHDQALIPLKLSGQETGVNLTIGLGLVRTSPLHGTAFDIAKNPYSADPGSMIEAIKLAVRCAINLKKA